MKIHIVDTQIEECHFTPFEWAKEAASTFKMNERVLGVAGEAFDFNEWYISWRSKNTLSDDLTLTLPTHLRITAVDEFTAIIPWEQLEQACFQYAIDGEALSKGYPIRIYVPNGTSECLNVKGVVKVEILYEPTFKKVATFGFKNQIKPEDMMLKKGNDDC